MKPISNRVMRPLGGSGIAAVSAPFAADSGSVMNLYHITYLNDSTGDSRLGLKATAYGANPLKSALMSYQLVSTAIARRVPAALFDACGRKRFFGRNRGIVVIA